MINDPYLWIKSLHIIAVIAWMAALLYLPRLYVYHADAPAGGEAAAMLCVMERRLLRYICTPAMLATWVLGITLIIMNGPEFFAHSGWLHVKILLVLILSGFHGFLAAKRRALAEGSNRHSAKFYRMINEVPTVLMVVIIFLVVVKPF